MNLFKVSLISIASTLTSLAGGLNVIQLGPDRAVDLEVKAGSISQKFSLSKAQASGGFILPNKKAKLRTVGDDIKSLEIKAMEGRQLAVLYFVEDTFRWKVFPSKATEGKTSLTLINLTDKPTTVTFDGKKIEIKEMTDQAIEGVNRAPIRVTLEDGKKQKAHEQDEPSAVVGFIYKEKEEWKIFYINDI